MIIFFLFFFLFFRLKTFFVLSSFLILDYSSIFTITLCFLVSYIIFYFYSKDFFSFIFLSKEYYFYLFCFILSVLFFFFRIVSSNPLVFLLFIELTVLPMFFLMLNYSKDRDKISSRILMIFFNVFSSIPFIYFTTFFSVDYFCCFRQLDFNFIQFNRNFLLFCCSLILLIKLPLFLFHFWLTKAHVRAFGCCSIILARIILKIGSFGLLKFL